MNQKVVTQNFIIEPTGDKYFSNLFVTSKKRNHEFTNLKCCEMSFKAFKMKKQALKRGFKRLSGLYALLQIREFVISFFDVTNRL